MEIAPQLSERDARLLADHTRASIFLIADGVRPSNKEAGYILRRLLRRVIATSIKNDIHSDVFVEVYGEVKKMFGEIYPEIKNEKEIIQEWNEEKSKFESAITQGLKHVEILNVKNDESGSETTGSEITGTVAFDIYQSYGLPREIIKEYSKRISSNFEAEFAESEKKHQEISKAGAEKKFGGHGLILDTGELKAGNPEEMSRVLRMHTATHLLHWALRSVLGESVHQMGSDINPERLRFDFNFDRKLTPEEIKTIELMVNQEVKKNLPVYFKEMSKEEATKSGALAFFREKYPDRVKVYFIGDEQHPLSKEFCGGPHVNWTGEIGEIKILKEESVGKGVRRLRATVN